MKRVKERVSEKARALRGSKQDDWHARREQVALVRAAAVRNHERRLLAWR